MKDIWMYLLPSGFIASLLTWLVNRRRERLKDIREEHSVYRELYEDLRVLIKKQGIEHGKMRRKIYRLERVLEEVSHCRQGISVLCCVGCLSTKTVSDRTVSRETVRLRQEVILLPETERLVISEDAIRNLPTGHTIRSHSDNKATVSGITLTKQADGLIDIACSRDTVRIRNDTVDESVREGVLLTEKEEPRSNRWVWIVVLLAGIFVLGKRK